MPNNAKIFNTRLQLKHDTLEQWLANDPVLLEGEIAIVDIPAETDAITGKVTQKPAVVFKVGDGVKEFSKLEWVSALAADVPAWAKVLKDSEKNDIPADAFISALEDIKTLKGYFGTGGGENDQTIPDQIKKLEDDLGAHIDNFNNLLGDDKDSTTLVPLTIRKIANDELAKQLLSGNADASFKTLQELAAWIEDHPEDASAMNEEITKLKNILNGFGTGDGELQSVKFFVEDSLATLANSLSKIAETGNINDLQQDANDFVIFNCGTSSTIINKPAQVTE